MLNYLPLLMVLCLSLLMSRSHAWGDWDAFDAMVNKNQDNITNRVNPCNGDQSDQLVDDDLDWREDKDGFHADMPIRMPSEADAKQLKARYMDGVLKIEIPKKKLKSII